MRFFNKTKDGGKDSTVDAFFLFEIKWLCSIALLRFNKGSRVNFHSHAFNAFTWFLKGDMTEHDMDGTTKKYSRRLLPKVTKREKFHKVIAERDSWCFTIRGAWQKEWSEYDPDTNETIILTHGRHEVSRSKYVPE